MTQKEKLNKLEELMDIEMDTLSEDTVLYQLEQWDSIAVIALIAMFDCDFERVVATEQIRELKKVKDILDLME